MKRRKVAKLMAVVALVGAVGVGGSLALLTATTGPVTNTFTAGKNLTPSDLKLDEYQLSDNNRTANKEVTRVKSLEFKNLMQRDVMDKDPTVQIKGTAAQCYIFVKVTGLQDLKNKGITVNWNNVWVKADGNTNTADGYYYYNGTRGAVSGRENVIDPSLLTDDNITPEDGYFELESLFTQVTVEDNATIYGADNKIGSIKAWACAVQAQNVDSWEDAYAALPGDFTNAE